MSIQKEQAKRRYELQRRSVKQISKELGIPASTLYDWIKKEGWKKGELAAEEIVRSEYSRVLAKPVYSREDLRKLKALRVIMDEYAQNRSLLVVELEKLVERHRANSSSDKNKILNELIELLEQFTGSALNSVKELRRNRKPNDFRGVSHAE